MSGRNRGGHTEASGLLFLSGVLLVAGLTYGLGYLQGGGSERRKQTPAAYSSAAKADVERACVHGIPGAIFECVYEKVKSAQEQARGEQDLSAQQRSAGAALASAILAALALIATVIGVWLIKRTLDATLQAVEDTSKATDAMRESNDITRDLARPWITIDCKFTRCDRAHNTYLINGELKYTNVGKTPATGFSEFSTALINNDEFADKWVDFIDKAYRVGASMSDEALMPNESITMPFHFDVSYVDADYIRDGPFQGVQIFVAAAAQYRSTTQRALHTRQTARCFILLRRKDDGDWDRGLNQFVDRVEPERLGSQILTVGRSR